MPTLFRLTLSILAVMMTTTLYCTEPTTAQRAELTALVNYWIKAEVQSNRDALSSILDDEFISTFASGMTINKKQYVDYIIGLDISPFAVTNEAMIIHGDTAVVIDITQNGKTKFTYIAQKKNRKWLVLAQTFTKVKQTHD